MSKNGNVTNYKDEKKYGNIKEYYDDNKNELNDSIKSELEPFLNEFTKDRIENLTLEEYCLGTENFRDSFSYALEWGTPRMGSIRGGTSTKFGVYFKDGKYKYIGKFKNEKDAIDRIKNSILSIINAKRIEDLDDLREKDDTLSNLVFNKIAYLYYSSELLPIFSIYDLEKFADKNGIKDLKNKKYFELNKTLLDKIYPSTVKSISKNRIYNLGIMWFLYGNNVIKNEVIKIKDEEERNEENIIEIKKDDWLSNEQNRLKYFLGLYFLFSFAFGFLIYLLLDEYVSLEKIILITELKKYIFSSVDLTLIHISYNFRFIAGEVILLFFFSYFVKKIVEIISLYGIYDSFKLLSKIDTFRKEKKFDGELFQNSFSNFIDKYSSSLLKTKVEMSISDKVFGKNR